jgi:hypothetical protein
MVTMSKTFCRIDARPNRFQYLILLVFLISGLGHVRADEVIFKNADRLTGEVKSLERGRLRFKTDATNTINIKWDEVAYLSSDQNMQVETDLGARHLGHLVRSEKKFIIVVETNTGPIKLNNIQVVHMTPIEEKGVDRIDGEITAGYNFTKASEVSQLYLGVELDYRTENRIWSLDLDAAVTDSETNEANQRESLDLQYMRLMRNRWQISGNVSVDRNDELGIDLRTSVGGGGRILRQSDHSSVVLMVGLLATRENLAGSTSDEETIETYGTLTWDWFRYDEPEFDLSTTLQIIPNLTDTGRVRGELAIKLKWQMIDDVFWRLEFYDSYDSRSGVTGAEKNDFGVITLLGYDF